MNITDKIHTAGRDSQRVIRGEAVTLHTAAGDISAEISDAVVTLPVPAVSRDAGPVEHDGVIRLAAAHHAAAVASHTVTVRGRTWDILTVGNIYAGTFRVEISRVDETHPNLFDLNQEQAEWE